MEVSSWSIEPNRLTFYLKDIVIRFWAFNIRIKMEFYYPFNLKVLFLVYDK